MGLVSKDAENLNPLLLLSPPGAKTGFVRVAARITPFRIPVKISRSWSLSLAKNAVRVLLEEINTDIVGRIRALRVGDIAATDGPGPGRFDLAQGKADDIGLHRLAELRWRESQIAHDLLGWVGVRAAA